MLQTCLGHGPHTTQFKLFQPNVLPQMPQNIVLELVVGGLAPIVNNPANVKTYAADMSRSWASHHTIQAISAECPPPDASEHCIRTCCWWSGPYSEQPCKCKNLCCRHVSVMEMLCSSDSRPKCCPQWGPCHEGWVIQGMLMEIVTDFGTEFLLIRAQKPRHKQQCGACSNQTLGLPALFRMTHQI